MSLILALAAAAAPIAPPMPPLTLREARSLSHRDLAARVLGAAGALYDEANLPLEGGMLGGPALSTIAFATKPRSSGFRGLCEADTLFVNFRPVGANRSRGDPPSRVHRIDTGRVYRIVADTTDRREGSDAEERALDARCAGAGPVLASQSRHLFFGGEQLGSAKAHLAARILQTVIAEARRAPVSHVACTEDPAEPAAQVCADPRALLTALPTDRLRFVEVDRCAENPVNLCADLSFGQPERPGIAFRTLRVNVEIDVARADPPPARFRILSVAIRHQTWVED